MQGRCNSALMWLCFMCWCWCKGLIVINHDTKFIKSFIWNELSIWCLDGFLPVGFSLYLFICSFLFAYVGEWIPLFIIAIVVHSFPGAIKGFEANSQGKLLITWYRDWSFVLFLYRVHSLLYNSYWILDIFGFHLLHRLLIAWTLAQKPSI